VSLVQEIKDALDLIADDVMVREFVLPFYKSGAQTTFVGAGHFPCLGSGIILGVRAHLNTAPTGATTFKVDVNKNDTTIFGTQANRPIWVASAKLATVGAHSVTTFADGDVFSIDVDAVGSTIAGSDLNVGVYLLRTA
jgi:hypothetical protein